MIKKIKKEIDELEVKSQQTFVNTDETYNYWKYYVEKAKVIGVLDKYLNTSENDFIKIDTVRVINEIDYKAMWNELKEKSINGMIDTKFKILFNEMQEIEEKYGVHHG